MTETGAFQYTRWPGNQTAPHVLVIIEMDDGEPVASVDKKGPYPEGDGYSWPERGEPLAMLDWARSFALQHAMNLYVRLDGVKWNPDWGVLLP